MFKSLCRLSLLLLSLILLPAGPQAVFAHGSSSGNGGQNGGSGGSSASSTPSVPISQLRPLPPAANVGPPFVRGVYQPVNLPIPVILQASNKKDRLKQMTKAVGHMMASIDPDLKSAAGGAPSLYERTDRLRDKLSAPDDVLRALETRARLEAAGGKDAPTAAEIERATQVLEAAAHELRDDVPAQVAEAVLHDPRQALIGWIIAVLAAGAIAASLLYYRGRTAAGD